jgi:WD40 repeat protein
MFVLSASSSEKEDADAANVQVWNPLSGTVQAVYKQASVPRHGLALLNPDCFVAASTGRAAIHFWNWRKEVPFLKATPPEKLGAVAASHKGIYCAGAGVSSGKVYIWDVSSGML